MVVTLASYADAISNEDSNYQIKGMSREFDVFEHEPYVGMWDFVDMWNCPIR